MSDSMKPPTEAGEPSALEQRLRMSKRSFVKLFLGSAAAYSVPLMASFSMEGLGIGKAQGQGYQFPPGLFVAPNQAMGHFPAEKFPFLAPNQTVPADPPGLSPFYPGPKFPD
jgi:hypothetical protein